jgi:hypothetical protein
MTKLLLHSLFKSNLLHLLSVQPKSVQLQIIDPYSRVFCRILDLASPLLSWIKKAVVRSNTEVFLFRTWFYFSYVLSNLNYLSASTMTFALLNIEPFSVFVLQKL